MEAKSEKAVEYLLESTGDPAFSVDEGGCVSGWNGPAERLLGFPKDEILGRPCHEVLRGKDVFGNPYCEPHCPLFLLARGRKPLRHFQMDVRTRDGAVVRVLCQMGVIPGSRPGTFSLVHLLLCDSDTLPLWPVRRESGRPGLTEREEEVLRRLCRGCTTRQMAKAMFVSTSTVKKHVQSLMRKLGVTSRLAAVARAMDERLR